MVIVLKSLAWVFARIPHGLALRVGAGLGWIFGNVIRHHRADAFDALAQSFPEKTPAQRSDIVREMYRHLGMNGVEFLRMLGGRADELDRLLSVSGEEHVHEALSRGKGVLALCSHIGNWEILALGVARLVQPACMIIKEMRQDGLNRYLIQSREQQGLRVFPRRGAYRPCRKALAENALVGFVMDQNMMWKEGVFVDFFGRPACTTPGLAHLAARTGTPVVPVFIERKPGGHHEIKFQPALEPPASREPEAILAATQAYTAIVERAIREHPDQWTWIHRRWRTTPDKVEQEKKLKPMVPVGGRNNG